MTPKQFKNALPVLEAADQWLTALGALAAADEGKPNSDDEQQELDAAEVALVAAVKTWRAAQG